MAVIITGPLDKPTNVVATLQAGGTLTADTTYYVKVSAKAMYQYYGWSGGSYCSPPSDQISFTTSASERSALITWNPVSNAIGKNVYCSDISGNFYQKHFGPDSGSTVTDVCINQYLISAPATGNGMDSFSSLPVTDYLPMKLNKELGSILINFNGTTTLNDIYNAIDASGLSDYVFYDSYTFALKGGFYCTGTTAGTFTALSKMFHLMQGGLRNDNPNLIMTFGEYSNGKTSGGCFFSGWYESPIYMDYTKFYGCFISNAMHGSYLYGFMASGAMPLPTTTENRDIKDTVFDNIGLGWVGLPLSDITINIASNAYWTGESSNVKQLNGYCAFTNNPTNNYGIPHFRNWTHNFSSAAYSYHYLIGRYPEVSTAGSTVNLYDCTYSINGVVTPNNLPIVYYDLDSPREFRAYNSISLKIVNKNGTALQNVNVILTNKDSSIVLNTTTDASGLITTTDILRATVNWNWVTPGIQDVSILYNPFTLIVSKEGFATYKNTFDLTEKIDWEISLSPPTTVFYGSTIYGGNIY